MHTSVPGASFDNAAWIFTAQGCHDLLKVPKGLPRMGIRLDTERASLKRSALKELADICLLTACHRMWTPG